MVENEVRGNNISGKNASIERGAGNAIKTAYEIEAPYTRAILTFTHYRRRDCDPDGPVIKWLLDSIVKAGLLVDDSQQYIKEIRHKFVKVQKENDEKTVVTIECEGD